MLPFECSECEGHTQLTRTPPGGLSRPFCEVAPAATGFGRSPVGRSRRLGRSKLGSAVDSMEWNELPERSGKDLVGTGPRACRIDLQICLLQLDEVCDQDALGNKDLQHSHFER